MLPAKIATDQSRNVDIILHFLPDQRREEHPMEKAVESMMTNLVDLEDARGRLDDGEEPYAFQVGETFTMLGPGCRFGSDYLRTLRTEGRYAESFEEATQVADARGATITGIWFVKR
jgi:hypothetical protein